MKLKIKDLITMISDKSLASTNQDIIDTINFTMNNFKLLLLNHEIGDVARWIIWRNKINYYGPFGPDKDDYSGKYASRRYSRGRKVFVDFGADNISSELCYAHPCIILYDFPNGSVVIPITEEERIVDKKRVKKTYDSEIEKLLIRVPESKPIFPENSILLVNRIKFIDKNRILNDLGVSIPNELLKDVEEKVARYFSPDIFHKKEFSEKECTTLKDEKQILESKNLELEKEVARLTKLLEEKELKLSKFEKIS